MCWFLWFLTKLPRLHVLQCKNKHNTSEKIQIIRMPLHSQGRKWKSEGWTMWKSSKWPRSHFQPYENSHRRKAIWMHILWNVFFAARKSWQALYGPRWYEDIVMPSLSKTIYQKVQLGRPFEIYSEKIRKATVAITAKPEKTRY